MKTFYTYDTVDGRRFVKLLLALIILSGIGIIVFGICAFLDKQKFMMNIGLFVACLSTFLLAIPARKKHKSRLEEETLVAHDWGVEHLIAGEVRETKWSQIVGVDTIDRGFILYSMKEYVISVANDAPVVFYSSLENSDFLINYIKKNLKKRADDMNMGWSKTSSKE